MHNTDFIVLIAVTLGIAAVGASFYSSNRSTYDYLSARGTLPGWLIGVSIFTTYVHSMTYIGYPGNALQGDWRLFVYTLPLPFVAWVIARWGAPRYRRRQDISAYAVLEERYGVATRRYAAVCYLLSQMIRVGVILFMLCMPFQQMLNWNIDTTIITVSLITTVYTLMGGMRGIIWAEAFQGLLIMVATIVCIFVLTGAMPGGVENAIGQAWENGKFSLGNDDFKFSEDTIWVIFIFGIASAVERLGTDQSHVQRYHAARSNRGALHAIMIGACLFAALSALLLLLGTMLYCYYSEFSVMLPENIPQDYIYPFFIVYQMPIGLCGLLVAALAASSMAAMSTFLITGSATLLNDFTSHNRQSRDEQWRSGYLKKSGILLAVAATGAALFMAHASEWMGVSWTFSSVLTGSVLGLLLLTLLVTHAKQVHTAVAVACALLVCTWISLWWWLGLPRPGISTQLSNTVGASIIVLVGFLLTAKFDRNGLRHQLPGQSAATDSTTGHTDTD